MAMKTSDGKFKEEAELARRVSLGDQDALTRLYENYFYRVYCYFYDEVRSHFEAKVLTTETFCLAVNALMNDHYLWQGKLFGSWLHSIAIKVFEEYKRTPLIDDLKRILDSNEPTREGNLPNFIAQQEAQKMLWHLVYELQPSERQVLILHHKNKLSYASIAMHLGYKEDVCRQLYNQALTNLKRRVQTFGLWSEARGG